MNDHQEKECDSSIRLRGLPLVCFNTAEQSHLRGLAPLFVVEQVLRWRRGQSLQVEESSFECELKRAWYVASFLFVVVIVVYKQFKNALYAKTKT